MNHKRKKHDRRLWRKSVSPMKSLKEWSRMLHLWWKRDVYQKSLFKKGKDES